MPIKVLIIDDDVDMTNVLELMLVNTGFNAKTVNSSPLGVELARQWQPDIIILDLIMPEMDGIEACRAIRVFNQNPILVLSVVNRPELIAHILDAGADDYLTKPVSESILVAHLKNLLRRVIPTHAADFAHRHFYG